MKTIVVVAIFLFGCNASRGIAQFFAPEKTVNAFAGQRGDSVIRGASAFAESERPALAEWKNGAKWALISTAGIAVSAILLLTGREGLAYLSIGIGFGSICTLPLFVAIGVDKIGKTFNPDGKAWQSFIGAFVGAAATLGLETMIFSGVGGRVFGNASIYTIFPAYALGAFVLVPLAAVLSYNLFGHSKGNQTTGALLNFHPGSFEIGAPVPVIYPNPFMQGKVCAQINLVNLSF